MPEAAAQVLMRAILVVGASVSLVGSGILMADAINPGTCPAVP